MLANHANMLIFTRKFLFNSGQQGLKKIQWKRFPVLAKEMWSWQWVRV